MSSAKYGVSVQILARQGKSSPGAARGNSIFKWRFVTNSEQALKIHNARAGTARHAWNGTCALSCVPDKGRRVFGFCNGAPG